MVAIITERGGPTGHAAILARSMGIPAITAVEGATGLIAPGTRVLVDGEQAEVTLLPTRQQRRRFDARLNRYQHATEEAVDAEQLVCATSDGQDQPAGEYRAARRGARGSPPQPGWGWPVSHGISVPDDPRPPDLDRQLQCYQDTCHILGSARW